MREDNPNILKQRAIDQGFCCQNPIMINDLPYHLEPKPKGRPHILEKNFQIEKNEQGELFARIPNGVHGRDYLAEDDKGVYCSVCGRQ